MLKSRLSLWNWGLEKQGEVPYVPLLPQPSLPVPTFLLLTPALLRKDLETQRETSRGLISACVSPNQDYFRKIFTAPKETQGMSLGPKEISREMCVSHKAQCNESSQVLSM